MLKQNRRDKLKEIYISCSDVYARDVMKETPVSYSTTTEKERELRIRSVPSSSANNGSQKVTRDELPT